MTKNINIVWFRQDLRINDNPALHYAAKKGLVLGIYIEAEEQRKIHHESKAKVGFIYDSLHCLKDKLNQLNIALHIHKVSTFEDQLELLSKLVEQYEATSLYFNNEYPLNEQLRDDKLECLFADKGVEVHRFDGDLALQPNKVRNLQGEPYKVFTPYKKAWIKLHQSAQIEPWSAPNPQQNDLPVQSLSSFEQDYRKDLWQPGEDAAEKILERFLTKVEDYDNRRDIPSVAGTSFLSPYLAVGVISVRQCIYKLYKHYQENSERLYGDAWLSELVWREFYRQVLIDNQDISKHMPYKKEDKKIWVGGHELFEAWKYGQTGFPIIDAAMRQLNQTGWMHNRLRMNVAMFLNKLCLVDWRRGESYFMERLIDGDFASNNGGWQWCSSTGADGAPYFRIMSPLAQSKRFDPDGSFIRKLVPELASLDNRSIHQPTIEQRSELGYPEPIIDYKSARKRALELLA